MHLKVAFRRPVEYLDVSEAPWGFFNIGLKVVLGVAVLCGGGPFCSSIFPR